MEIKGVLETGIKGVLETGIKRVSETGIKRVSETGTKRVSETGKFWLKKGKIFAILVHSSFYPHLCSGRQNRKNFD